MSLEANKQLVRRLYEEAFNEGDLELVESWSPRAIASPRLST